MSSQKPSLLQYLLDTLASFFSSYGNNPRTDTKAPANPQGNADRNTDPCKDSTFKPLRVVIEQLPPPLPVPVDRETREINRDVRDQHRFRIEMICAGISILGVFITVATLLLTRQTASTANRSAITAARQLELSERPWISVENVRVPSGLVIQKGAVLTIVAMDIKNIGHTPAIGVNAYLQLHPSGGQVEIIVKRLCEGNSSGPDGLGETIFPDKAGAPNISYPINLSKADLATFWSLPAEHHMLAVAGCVHYRSSISQTEYYTGFLYNLIVMPQPTEPTGAIPASSIQLQEAIGLVVK